MFFRKSLNKPLILEDICKQSHNIVETLTRDLSIPDDQAAEIVRKKVAIFIFGIISAFAKQQKIEASPAYQFYLQYTGGLNKKNSFEVVERAQRRIDLYEEARQIYYQGMILATQWIDTNTLNRQLFLESIGLQKDLN